MLYYDLFFMSILIVTCSIIAYRYEQYLKKIRKDYYDNLRKKIKTIAQEDIDNALILIWLKTALDLYIRRSNSIGLCFVLLTTFEELGNNGKELCYKHTNSKYLTINNIVKIIPEFTTTYFGIDEKNENDYWWEENDRTSRINALQELIDLYERKTNKTVISIVKELNNTNFI